MSITPYVGKTIGEATLLAQQAGLEVVVEVAGTPQNLNCEYRQGRISFKVQNGIVTNAHLG